MSKGNVEPVRAVTPFEQGRNASRGKQIIVNIAKAGELADHFHQIGAWYRIIPAAFSQFSFKIVFEARLSRRISTNIMHG